MASDNLVSSLLEALGLQKQKMVEYLGTTVVPVLLPGLRRLARRLVGRPGDDSFEVRASMARSSLQHVVAPLADSLRHIYRARPADPIDGLAVALFRRSDEDALRWLAQFLMRHNPRHAASFPLEKAVWFTRTVETPEPPDEPSGVLRRERRTLRYGLEEREFDVVVTRDEQNVHFVCTADSLSVERVVSESELQESLTASRWRVSTAEAASDLAQRIRITHSKAINSPLVIEFAPRCERLATTARVFDGAVYVLDVLREKGDVAIVAYDPAVSTAVELRLPNQSLATSLDDAKRQVERIVRRLCWRHNAPALELAAPHDRDVPGGARLEVAAYAVVSNDDVVTLEIIGRPHGEPATSTVVVAEPVDVVTTDEPVQALLDGLRYEAGHLAHERQSSSRRIDDGTLVDRSRGRRRRQAPDCDPAMLARRDDVLRRRRDRRLRERQRLDVNGGFVAHRQVQDFGQGQYRVVSVVVLAHAASGAVKFEAYDPTTSESRSVQADFVDTRGFFEPDAKAVARLARRYCRRLRFEEDRLVLWQKDAFTTKLRRVFDAFDDKDLRGRVAKRDVADVFDATHTHLDTFLKAATTSRQSHLPPLLDAPTADAARACLGRAQSRLESASRRLSFPSFAATLCEAILDDD